MSSALVLQACTLSSSDMSSALLLQAPVCTMCHQDCSQHWQVWWPAPLDAAFKLNAHAQHVYCSRAGVEDGQGAASDSGRWPLHADVQAMAVLPPQSTGRWLSCGRHQAQLTGMCWQSAHRSKTH